MARYLVAQLKACAKRKDVFEGSRFHADIFNKGLLQKNIFIGNSLINMYAKCGALSKAREVFDELPVRDVISWNTLIAGYSQNGCSKEAINCFDQMQHDGLCPDASTFACILQSCGRIGAAEKGRHIHAQVTKEELVINNCILGSALVSMYVKCGELAKAQEVLQELPVQDVVSWNALIAGLALLGHSNEAIDCFEHMQQEGLSPNAVSFISLLKACGHLRDAKKGKQVHAVIAREGFLLKCNAVGNALVDMYARCSALAMAQQVFDDVPVRDVISWTTLITAYVQSGYAYTALTCFMLMQQEGFFPDIVTFACILKACGSIAATETATNIHVEISKEGFLKEDNVIGTALVDVYAEFGELAKAQEVFDELLIHDLVCWNALIAGYSEYGYDKEAMNCYEEMQHEGLYPDPSTFSCILKACGTLGAVEKGNDIYADIFKEKLLGKNKVLDTSLLDMYAKFGEFAKAQEVFDQLPDPDLISWNALITGCSQQGYAEEALKYFAQLQGEGLYPDRVTFLCILKACGEIGEVEKGKQLHVDIMKAGLLGEDSVVCTSLIDMYGKCGDIPEAQEVLEEFPFHTVHSWNALISGHSQHGNAKEALNCFQQMQLEGLSPDAVTFLCILSACSCAGFVAEGHLYFNVMGTRHDIKPSLKHYTSMVDLFGRHGLLDRALAMIKKVPSSYTLALWYTLLSACRKWGNINLGRLAFEHAVGLDNKSALAYIYMTDIYAAAGMQEHADKIKAMRLKNEAWKVPGQCWWTHSGGDFQLFSTDDKQQSHSCERLA